MLVLVFVVVIIVIKVLVGFFLGIVVEYDVFGKFGELLLVFLMLIRIIV